MTLTRRDAIRISGTTLASLSLGLVRQEEVLAQVPGQAAQVPPELVEQELRPRVPLPLNPDGSAPEYSEMDAGPISEPLMWRYTQGRTPPGESDYRRMQIKLDPRGNARYGGTLTFDDLEDLPRVSRVHLLQCGVPNPRGIVKWTGVRFRDFAEKIELQPYAHYGRFVAADRYFIDEEVATLMHPQVMLAWLMNDAPIPPEHGAPLRLIIPFRYGARNIKAITEITFGSPGLPTEPLPA